MINLDKLTYSSNKYKNNFRTKRNYKLIKIDINNRRKIIEIIKKNTNLINCDLFIMLDLDDMGTYRIEEKNILDSVKFLFSKEKIAAVFANQLGTYYDMWTLRDQKYCKNDFWVEVLQFLIKNKNLSEQISKDNFMEAKKEIIDKKTFM